MPSPTKALPGERFTRWLVTGFGRQTRTNGKMRICKCDCGTVREVRRSLLLTGQSKSCGCYYADATRARELVHGQSSTPEYHVWKAIVSRCTKPTDRHYKDYGRRGIKLCERWLRFENFLADMGLRPAKGLMVERKNNDGDYEPGNCVWATAVVQARNTRRNVNVLALGKVQCIAAWAEELVVPQRTISGRLRKGWSHAQALGLAPKPTERSR